MKIQNNFAELIKELMSDKRFNSYYIIKFGTILQTHEEAVAEKDKKIEKLLNKQTDFLNRITNLKMENDILKSKQLFKEDFIEDEIICKCKNINCDFPGVIQYVLKDNSKYELLDSKECD